MWSSYLHNVSYPARQHATFNRKECVFIAYPHGATISRPQLEEPILAEQVEKRAVGLQQAALVLIDAQLPQHPLVHEGRVLNAVPKPVLDLDLAHQHRLHAPLERIEDGWHLEHTHGAHVRTLICNTAKESLCMSFESSFLFGHTIVSTYIKRCKSGQFYCVQYPITSGRSTDDIQS